MEVPGDRQTTGKLGTFGGVFTPSLLTILGLVLFLRLGFVIGNVGLVAMLAILALATAVSILTTISMAAMATNIRVRGGGVYFLISRSLGPAYGGAIGIVMYVSIAVSVAFYSIGVGESVANIIGSNSSVLPRLIAASVVLALLGLAWLGADIATRLQYLVMIILVVSIVGYMAGVSGDLSLGRLGDSLARPSDGSSFWVAFAIFFPAITGFTQGVSMSGDLKTPSSSITKGTFAAIAVSTLVYLAVILTLVLAVPLNDLKSDTSIMRSLSLHPALIDAGVVAATLSSAIASILGAPRILQRIAADKLIKPLNVFSVGAGPANNPRRAVLVTTVIALVTIGLGDLDVIAPIISMFFLATFGMINFATYSELRAANTSFRPTFRYSNWQLSLLGTVACIGAILAIDPLAGGIAGLAVFALFRYLSGSVKETRWVDSSAGFHISQIRNSLRSVAGTRSGRREWRPFTIAFVPRDEARRTRLVTVADWFEGSAGFTTAVRIVPGSGAVARKHALRVRSELEAELVESGTLTYGRVLVARDLEAGVAAVLQSHGIGDLEPNLALFSWHSRGGNDQPMVSDMAALLQTGIRHRCNTAVVYATETAWRRLPASGSGSALITVWWSDERSGQLLTLLAWLCTRTPFWSAAKIQIVVESGTLASVRQLVEEARIPAEVRRSVAPSDFELLASTSSLMMAPLRVRRGSVLGPGGALIDDLVDEKSVMVFVQPGAEIALDVQPDEGVIPALAEAQDRASEAAQRAEELDTKASALMVEAELMRMEYESAGRSTDDSLNAKIKAARHAQRKYVDARTRADEAVRRARAIDPTLGNGQAEESLWQSAKKIGP